MPPAIIFPPILAVAHHPRGRPGPLGARAALSHQMQLTEEASVLRGRLQLNITIMGLGVEWVSLCMRSKAGIWGGGVGSG